MDYLEGHHLRRPGEQTTRAPTATPSYLSLLIAIWVTSVISPLVIKTELIVLFDFEKQDSSASFLIGANFDNKLGRVDENTFIVVNY